MQAQSLQRSAPARVSNCGDIDIHIVKDGTWFHEGGEIRRKELVHLFASVLKRDGFGDYWLETPVERARIMVDDAPFLGVELFTQGTHTDQKLSVRTNIDEVIPIDLDHPLRVSCDSATGEPAPYVTVRAGEGMFPVEAKLTRAVFYELVERGMDHILDDETVYGVWSHDEFFILG